MRHGWKTRIDERRYFEEKRAKQFESVTRRIKEELHQQFLLGSFLQMIPNQEDIEYDPRIR
jgi:hypothetical protein